MSDQPLFDPPEIGLEIETWEELRSNAKASRCQTCQRELRSAESIAAGIGPCCAAKLGRAVARGRIRKARTPAA